MLQHDAASAVAGYDPLTVIVGPAGAGKTTMLRAAVTALHAPPHRAVVGFAPTAKAARVLEDETGMLSDTVAKLVYEWSRPDRPPDPWWQYGPGTTVVVDEAGMLATHDLHRMMQLARQERWRLVLVGDPHQLQAVGRGGMFAELCTAGRTIELERIHRFVEPWEAAASLQLRHGDSRALDAYEAHGRIGAGAVDEHADTIATLLARPPRPGRVARDHDRPQRRRRHSSTTASRASAGSAATSTAPAEPTPPTASAPTSATSSPPAATTARSSPRPASSSATATSGS